MSQRLEALLRAEQEVSVKSLPVSDVSWNSSKSAGEQDVGTLKSFDKFDVLGTDETNPTRGNLPRRRSKEDLAMGASTKVSHVENSWYLISGRIGEVGLKFFLSMFDEYPEIVKIFPFGEDSINPRTGKFVMSEQTKKHVRAHAIAVMRVVGTCVAGLTKIEDLIPRLRTVGATHKTVGVQPIHYDILYKHLIRAIRDEVGPDNWNQETEDAWEQAFLSISDMIKRPSKRLETEPLRGWGIIMLLSCSYFMLVTPFRFAGFLYGHANMVILLDTLDALAASTMAIDMVINFIQTKLRIGNITQILEAEENMELDMLRRRFRREFPNDDLPSVAVLKQFYKANRPGLFKSFRKSVLMFYYRRRVAIYGALQSLRMDRWVPWPALDARVLISFPLQWMYMPTSICAQVGLHWTQLFGMIRFLTVTRVWHAMLCAENNALIEQQLDANRQVQIRVTKLLLALALIIHISACTWCTIARLRLGVEAEGFEPTTFFPSTDILYGEGSNVLRSYSRAVHWAFVNLSGIGDVDSTPETALECFTILMVHIMGAIFFAIVTGNVIAMLEEKTQSENKIGSDIVKLSSYLENVRVSEFSKDRIMKGYMMRNVLTQGGETTAAASEGPDANDEILKTLPKYLRHEVAIYARAELIHRKDIFFSHCSKGFLVALSSGLPNVRTLLSGDYLMKEGQLYRDQFVLVESGQLQVREEGHTIKILGRGDCIGKAWLLQLKHEAKHEKLVEKTDWVKNDGTAVLSIRALSPCTLFTGLYTDADIRKLKRGYKIDFQLLQAGVHGNRKSESEKKAIARKVLAKAAQRYINRKRSKAEQVKKWQISGRKVITANAFIHETGRAVENRKEKEPDCMGCMLM